MPVSPRIVYGAMSVSLIFSALAQAMTPFGAEQSDTSAYALGRYVWNVVFIENANNKF